MPESAEYIRSIVIDYLCDTCGKPMTRDPLDRTLLLSDPPQYRNRCENGHTMISTRDYPCTAYLRTGEKYVLATPEEPKAPVADSPPF